MTADMSLATPRLVLTPIAEADFADLLALTSHPDVGGKLKHGVLTEAETRAQLATYLDSWARNGFGVFAIRTKASSAFAGIVGLWEHDDGIGVALRYAVMPDHRGQGLAQEAAKAVLDFADRKNIRPVIAVTRENNLASRRILTDLGFALQEIRDGKDHRTVIYSLAGAAP
jgi:RimJ/RimL family protein N-acetyltransferase